MALLPLNTALYLADPSASNPIVEGICCGDGRTGWRGLSAFAVSPIVEHFTQLPDAPLLVGDIEHEHGWYVDYPFDPPVPIDDGGARISAYTFLRGRDELVADMIVVRPLARNTFGLTHEERSFLPPEPAQGLDADTRIAVRSHRHITGYVETANAVLSLAQTIATREHTHGGQRIMPELNALLRDGRGPVVDQLVKLGLQPEAA